MSILQEIAEAIDAVEASGAQVVAIEIGERQARALADELSEPWYVQQRLGFTWDNTAPPPITWERLLLGRTWLFGVRLHGVESPDMLGVVAGSPTLPSNVEAFLPRPWSPA